MVAHRQSATSKRPSDGQPSQESVSQCLVDLHYNYFRDYEPAIGRYVQSDPIGLGGGLNAYEYVRSRPLSFWDARGLEACGYDSPACRCAGGIWDQDVGDFGVGLAAGFFIGGARQNVSCRSNRRLRCRSTQVCFGGGLVWGVGANYSVSGTIHGVERCTGLEGWSDTQFNAAAGPFGFQAPIGSPGGSMGVGPGVGGGAAFVTCYTRIWGCDK